MTTFQLAFRRIPASLLRDTLHVIGASLLLALSAQICIPHFFSTVPLTLQTLAVMWIGGALGATKGALAVIAYLVEGGIGLPVFAEWKGGAAVFFHPSVGYLIGFLFQAYFMGLWTSKHSSFCYLLAGALFSCFLTLGFGILWLALLTGWQGALLLGLYPFIPAELIKSLVIARYFAK